MELRRHACAGAALFGGIIGGLLVHLLGPGLTAFAGKFFAFNVPMIQTMASGGARPSS